MSLQYIVESIFAEGGINPVKILILFISMTILSVFLDELGFFSYLANVTLKNSGGSQKKLFFLLYIIVSILTIFTSNDIIVLTFTPFICYFTSNAGIKPLPYLVTVFVAANTWSMALIIGNPTNIYLATYGGIAFLKYLKIMILPTVVAGMVSFFGLYFMFRKSLSTAINHTISRSGFIKDIPLLIIGLIHLCAATILLAVGPYLGFEMWLIAFLCVVSLFICNFVVAIIKHRKPVELIICLRRAPWSLVPFLLIMFILILYLKTLYVPQKMNALIGNGNVIMKYGVLSFIMCNIINNIPMSVLFCSVVEPLDEIIKEKALYSVIIGSNIGAFLTPVGALAGLMWIRFLKKNGIKFGYIDFIKNCGIIGCISIVTALLVLSIILK